MPNSKVMDGRLHTHPETQAVLNAKWDRYNVDAALGLSEESQSDGIELE